MRKDRFTYTDKDIKGIRIIYKNNKNSSMTTTEANLKKSISDLKKSPLFNLSLSSMELFHSNFLYWIAKNNSIEFGKQFAEFLKLKIVDTEIQNISTEKGRIDFSFKYKKTGQEILFENKVKSLPNKAQLEKYYIKNKGTKKYLILLSLSEPPFKICGWSYLTYEELGNIIKNILKNINDDYHKQIIEDYLNFISCLVNINKHINLSLADFYNFYCDNNFEQFKDIRLHGFYLKKKYERFSYLIYENLKKQKIPLAEFNEKIVWESEEEKVFIRSDMTRGMGIADLKYRIAKNIVLGIQIQGNQYRMVVEDDNSKNANRLKDNLKSYKIWFDFSKSFPKHKIYPTSSSKEFNKYGNTFFYKSVKINEDMKVSELLNIISKDIKLIRRNVNKIKNILEGKVKYCGVWVDDIWNDHIGGDELAENRLRLIAERKSMLEKLKDPNITPKRKKLLLKLLASDTYQERKPFK